MATREWTIETPYRHDIRVEHGYWSGRVKLFVDECLIFERPPTLFDYGFQSEFVVDEIPCVIQICTDLFRFQYEFRPNSTLNPTDSTITRPAKATLLAMAAIYWTMTAGLLIVAFFVPPPKLMIAAAAAMANLAFAILLTRRRLREKER